jgi:hypothetical protein
MVGKRLGGTTELHAAPQRLCTFAYFHNRSWWLFQAVLDGGERPWLPRPSDPVRHGGVA